MKSASLKTRLVMSFSVVLTITIAIAVVGIVNLLEMNQEFERVVSCDVEKVKICGQLEQDAQHIFRQRQYLLFAESDDEISQIRQKINDYHLQMDERINRISLLINADEKEIFQAIAQKWNSYETLQEKYVSERLLNRNNEKNDIKFHSFKKSDNTNSLSNANRDEISGNQISKETIIHAENVIQSDIKKIIDDIDAQLDVEVNNTNRLFKRSLVETIGLFLLALIFSIVMFILIFRHIMFQIGGEPLEVFAITDQISKGNLRVKFDTNRKKNRAFMVLCQRCVSNSILSYLQ